MSERTELPDDVKLFVVQALACWDTPSEVARAVKEQFDIVVSRQAVQGYDPTKSTGRNLSAEYRKLFEATREAFLADTAEIGVAHRSVRLRTLQRLATKAEAMGNLPLVADLMERAAKEMGNAFTNKRELTGADGKPFQAEITNKGPDLSALDQAGRDALRTIAEQLAGRSSGDSSGA